MSTAQGPCRSTPPPPVWKNLPPHPWLNYLAAGPNLNLGSGHSAAEFPGWVIADKSPYVPGVNVIFDAAERFPFDDEHFNAVYSKCMVTYLPNDKKTHVMNEIWRVLKPGGRVEIFCSAAGFPDSFIPPGHQSYWSLTTFDYFLRGHWRCEFERPYGGFIGGFKALLLETIPSTNCEGRYNETNHVILEKS